MLQLRPQATYSFHVSHTNRKAGGSLGRVSYGEGGEPGPPPLPNKILCKTLLGIRLCIILCTIIVMSHGWFCELHIIILRLQLCICMYHGRSAKLMLISVNDLVGFLSQEQANILHLRVRPCIVSVSDVFIMPRILTMVPCKGCGGDTANES